MKEFLNRICPHWWTEKYYLNAPEPIMYEVVKREKCVICGKIKVHVKAPEPHPSRNKEEVVDRLQHPEHELIVDEWKPYGSTVCEESE